MKSIFYSIGFVILIFGSVSCELQPSYLPPPETPQSPGGECNLGDLCQEILCTLAVCSFGNDPEACSCCPVCLKGPNESCGGPSYSEGRCIENHICVDETLQEINVTDDQYSPVGKCRSQFCPDCALLDCVPADRLECDKGTVIDPYCGCCSVCQRGLNEECGGPLSTSGACIGDALVCEDEEWKPIFPGENETIIGSCRYADGFSLPPGVTDVPKPEECPDCSLILCSLPKCDYGTVIDPVCGCCPVCRKSPGDSCGKVEKEVSCGEGLVCENNVCVKEEEENATEIRPATLLAYVMNVPPSDSYGPPTEECPNCAAVSCGIPKCDYGFEQDPVCGCCPICKKGPGESCGGVGLESVSCGDGLVCEDKICVQQTTPPTEECPNCAAVSCGIPRCDYGTELDPVCGCCPICKKGPGESCGGVGFESVSCGDGLVCEDKKCVEQTTVEPGCLDCRLVRVKCVSPEALGCPDDYEMSTCTCCPECRKKPGYNY